MMSKIPRISTIRAGESCLSFVRQTGSHITLRRDGFSRHIALKTMNFPNPPFIRDAELTAIMRKPYSESRDFRLMTESRFNAQFRWMIVLLLLMWALLLLYVNSPFFGHHDANGIWLGAAARNFRIYPIQQFGLVPVLSRGLIPPDVPNLYVHHPPLLVWMNALAETLFGEHELSLRMVSIFSTMISIAAFFRFFVSGAALYRALFCRRMYQARRGLLFTALYALTPTIIYFGRMPDHEPLALAFLMLFLAAYVNWMHAPSRKGWFLMALWAFLGIWTAWADFFFVVLVAFTGLWAVRRNQRLSLILLGAVGPLALVTIVGAYLLSYPDTIKALLDAFNWRTSTLSETSTTFTWLEFAGEILVHLMADMTFCAAHYDRTRHLHRLER